MSNVFKALADPTRRAILLMVAEQPHNVNAIAERFNMSRPAVSKHLKILNNSGLTRIETDTKDGRQRNCYAQLEALNEIHAYLDRLQAFWSSRLDGLASFLEENDK